MGEALVVLLSARGEVFTMGENLEGQLGTNYDFHELPIKV